MKTKIVVLSFLTAIAFAGLSAIAQDSANHPTAEATPAPSTTPKVQKYTCEMHPEVITDKPGKCPKCGMKLIPLKEPAPKK